MKKYILTTLIIFIIHFATAQKNLVTTEITPQELQTHIKFLASDELKGRRAGEEGNKIAAEYIANEFQKYGLLPAGDNGTYFQNFSFISERKITNNNKLSITLNGERINYTLNEQFKPLTITTDTSLTTSLVFVGYGISASDSLQYDDYNGINVKDKIVIAMRYSPDTSNSSRFDKYTSITAKLFAARDKGAAGIIFVSSPPGTSGDKFLTFDDPRFGGTNIAVLTVKWDYIYQLMNRVGKDLMGIKKQIDSTRKPNSFEIPNAVVTIQTEIEKIKSYSMNVVGFIPGTDSLLKQEYLIIGAHFDHLGMGGEGSGSLKPDTIAPHHGADDNASGTAGLLEVAQYFSAHRDKLKRSLLFISFSGEELGLLGSDYYVKHPSVSLDKSITMINMDMIGRMKDSILVVEGMGTSPKFEEIVKRNNADSLILRLKPDGFGPSDQASFYMKDMPVIFFFTNLHSDYHKPSDTWDKINYNGEKTVLNLVTRIINELASENERPLFTKTAAPPSMGGDRQGAKVSLGVIPDFSSDVAGMKISGTRPGSAAEKAGLKGEDIIIKFGGKDVKNIYDFTYLLGQFKPGDEVEIVVKRGSEEILLKALLEAKR